MIKGGDAGEDDVKRAEKELEATTHRFVGQVDDLLRAKESELLEV
jgi:ribosome recycling factor